MTERRVWPWSPFLPPLPAPASLVGGCILPLPRVHTAHHLHVGDFTVGKCWGPGSRSPVQVLAAWQTASLWPVAQVEMTGLMLQGSGDIGRMKQTVAAQPPAPSIKPLPIRPVALCPENVSEMMAPGRQGIHSWEWPTPGKWGRMEQGRNFLFCYIRTSTISSIWLFSQKA